VSTGKVECCSLLVQLESGASATALSQLATLLQDARSNNGRDPYNLKSIRKRLKIVSKSLAVWKPSNGDKTQGFPRIDFKINIETRRNIKSNIGIKTGKNIKETMIVKHS